MRGKDRQGMTMFESTLVHKCFLYMQVYVQKQSCPRFRLAVIHPTDTSALYVLGMVLGPENAKVTPRSWLPLQGIHILGELIS